MKSFTLLFIAIVFSVNLSAQCTNGATGNQPGEQFTLVWQDEFEINGPVCSENWHHQTQLPAGGSWYNGEIQHYTDRTDNAIVDDGVLHIVARKETFTDQNVTKNYTTARLNSKFAFTYGRVEVRAKLPTGVGTWPAIWMLGKNINEDGGYWDSEFGTTNWPACGEIDIMEHWGHNQNFVQSAMHTPSSSGSTINKGGQTIPTVSTEFHVYQLEWTPEKMVFSVDDVEHYTYNPAVKDASTWPFDAEQYLLLNFAVLPSIETSFTQDTLSVDYVRVYQKSDYNVNFPEETAANPTVDASDVTSVYSDSYANLTNVNFNPNWQQTTTFETFSLSDNEMLRYKNFNYQGIELNQNLDLTSKTHLHLDLWTKDADVVKVTIISNYGDTQEYLVGLAPLTQKAWNSYDIPLTSFSDQGVPLDAVFQLKLDGQAGTTPSEIFVDNIYFYNQTTPPDVPTAGPSDPVEYQNMISLFSDSFTNVPMDTWRTSWSVADMEEVTLSGNDAKKYYNLDYAGIEMINNQIDLTNMTHVHLDYWTPDAQEFGFKLVDFGADGVYSPQVDDSEDYVAMDPLVTHEWASMDIPLSEFANLQSIKNMAQIILVGQPAGSATVYIDNFYFHNNQPENLVIRATETASRNIICNNLTVNAGNTLTIDAGYSLTIHGDMDIQGELVINSGASLITFEGNQMDEVTIRRNTRYADGKYSFVGSPVEQSTEILGADLGSWVYEYDETVSYGADGLARWKDASANQLETGKGYAQAGQKEITFTGIPNSGAINYTGTFTDRSDDNDGWNLVANPYAAAISVEQFLASNSNTTRAIYLWDDNGSDVERGSNADYIVANALAATQNSLAGNGNRYNGYLGSGQGFFVQLQNANNTTITFAESMRDDSNNEDQHFFRQLENEKELIRINLTDQNGLFRQAVLGMVDDTDTEALNPQYDARVFNEENTSIYTIKGEEHLAIQGIDREDEQVAIGLTIEQPGVYQIDFMIENMILGNWYLYDRHTDQYQSISENYSFMVTSAGKIRDRFVLVKGIRSILTIPQHHQMFVHDHQLHLPEDFIGELRIYNLMGQCVFYQPNTMETTIPLRLPSGVYLVKSNKRTQKVIIR